MPKRTDIESILVIGSGPIVIGQACEFDYSGTQAVKVLRQEGYRVILVNSNPATIMTDPEVAPNAYIEPLVPEVLEKNHRRRAPRRDPADGRWSNRPQPRRGAGRERSAGALRCGDDRRHTPGPSSSPKIGKNSVKRCRTKACRCLRPVTLTASTRRSCWCAPPAIPSIVRASFTLGGGGAGVAYNVEEFKRIVEAGLRASPIGAVQIEESILGWKEYELEVMRDRADNFVVVCSIENLDAMGVHTGDSITVAPAITLSDREYQQMRDWARRVISVVGVETGGSNIQFGVHPADGRMVVIEMNPRVSRSSALASKATGFPIAKIAALLAVGYTLDEIPNDITEKTPAAFEPTIDYVVVKIPRFTFEKFPGRSDAHTQMRSVGEVMAIGRTFREAMQKAFRSLETGRSGWGEPPGSDRGLARRARARRLPSEVSRRCRNCSWIPTWRRCASALRRPQSDRLDALWEGFNSGLQGAEMASLTGYDPWFGRSV